MLSDDIRRIHARVENMQSACAHRDADINRVRLVRRGRIDELAPSSFADDLPKSIVANVIDTAARDQAELSSPLPSLACASGNMTTNADEIRASKKNKIGSYYWAKSRLALQNIDFADSINSYSFGAYIVEPDFQRQCPRIRWESSFGAYYYQDRWGHVRWYAKVTEADVGTLAAQYPERESEILYHNGRERSLGEVLRVVTYYDETEGIVYLPEAAGMVLARARHGLSRPPVVIAERPDTEDMPRGQYDDVVWTQLAKHYMATYMLKAADKSVNAPLALPDDVSEIAYGEDSILRSATPEKIGRVRLDIPRDVFALQAELDTAAKEGARYPEARTGGIKGNIVTGRGVQELMGTMDTQVRTMQTIIGHALEEVTSLCFEMDEALWPNIKKTITGVLTGKPFELTYIPSKDIAGSYGCKVTYGFAAGLSPSQAIVALLQLRGDDLISRDTFRRQLPFDLDAEEEQRAIDTQQLEDSLKQGLMALTQALGPMVAQGQDPLPVVLGVAKAVELRQKGRPLTEAIIAALTPPEQPEPQAPQIPEQGAPPGAEQMQGEMPPGMRDNGLQQGVAFGQQGMAPGGMPAISALMASMRGNGDTRLEASVLRKRAVGSG